jgi:hypothetical protein
MISNNKFVLVRGKTIKIDFPAQPPAGIVSMALAWAGK